MKKRICLGAMLMTLIVTVGAATPAVGQSSNILVFDIPFEFYVGSKAIPAGTYDVTRVSADGSALMIRRRADGKEAMVVLTHHVQSKPDNQAPARLLFNRYDDQYFLSSVWDRGAEGRAIPKSKRERNLRQELLIARTRSNAQPRTVTVAARLK